MNAWLILFFFHNAPDAVSIAVIAFCDIAQCFQAGLVFVKFRHILFQLCLCFLLPVLLFLLPAVIFRFLCPQLLHACMQSFQLLFIFQDNSFQVRFLAFAPQLFLIELGRADIGLFQHHVKALLFALDRAFFI